MHFDHPDLRALRAAQDRHGSRKAETPLTEKVFNAIVATDPTVDGEPTVRRLAAPDAVIAQNAAPAARSWISRFRR